MSSLLTRMPHYNWSCQTHFKHVMDSVSSYVIQTMLFIHVIRTFKRNLFLFIQNKAIHNDMVP